MLVDVRHLSRSFEYYKKDLGLKNSLKNLFSREKLTKQAVCDISFQIEAGEMVGFLGPNGAGKTTTLKMLSGILHPTSGQASVLGFVPWERKKATVILTSHYMGDVQDLCRRSIIINQGQIVYDCSSWAKCPRSIWPGAYWSP